MDAFNSLADSRGVLAVRLEQAIIRLKPNQTKPNMTRNQINNTFLFQNRVKVKVVGDVSEK